MLLHVCSVNWCHAFTCSVNWSNATSTAGIEFTSNEYISCCYVWQALLSLRATSCLKQSVHEGLIHYETALLLWNLIQGVRIWLPLWNAISRDATGSIRNFLNFTVAALTCWLKYMTEQYSTGINCHFGF